MHLKSKPVTPFDPTDTTDITSFEPGKMYLVRGTFLTVMQPQKWTRGFLTFTSSTGKNTKTKKTETTYSSSWTTNASLDGEVYYTRHAKEFPPGTAAMFLDKVSFKRSQLGTGDMDQVAYKFLIDEQTYLIYLDEGHSRHNDWFLEMEDNKT